MCKKHADVLVQAVRQSQQRNVGDAANLLI